MKEMRIEPLRKCKASGEVYSRRSSITDFIASTNAWSFNDFMKRAAVRDRRNDEFVPSEVLVYFLR